MSSEVASRPEFESKSESAVLVRGVSIYNVCMRAGRWGTGGDHRMCGV